jgi:integrase
MPVSCRHRRDAWTKAELEPIGLHEARHTFASLMIGAGVNAKALSAYMGHASVTLTLDRYGQHVPGQRGGGGEPTRRLPRTGYWRAKLARGPARPYS